MVIIQQMLTFIVIIIIPTLPNCKKSFQVVCPLFFPFDPIDIVMYIHSTGRCLIFLEIYFDLGVHV